MAEDKRKPPDNAAAQFFYLVISYWKCALSGADLSFCRLPPNPRDCFRKRTLFAEQNQLIPQAALGPCYRDHGCQIAAIVIFREVLQKVHLRTKNTATLKCFVKRETSQHITEWKDGNAASNAEQLRVAVCQGSFVILSAFNLKRQRTATKHCLFN
ncbi:hypothetical protein T03_17079 [Trichinella britovi]|uniref:Uncharacterized protein n=1 Tax=Trichinella britovi TaxID=45882 RepID=A0A0V1CW02_TRIBR|nr:hypothetical protein T03_17079 [Trichinella britovi]